MLFENCAKVTGGGETAIVMNTSIEDIVEVLPKELAESRGVDVAIDCLGESVMGTTIPRTGGKGGDPFPYCAGSLS